jgi:hypothetical protein
MDKMRATVYLSVVFAMFGLFLVASGLNGFIVLIGFDKYNKPVCELTQDCSADDICCLLEGETSGVCVPNDTCEQLLVMPTKTVEPPMEITPPPNVPQIVQIISGLLLTVLSGFMLYYANRLGSNRSERSKQV